MSIWNQDSSHLQNAVDADHKLRALPGGQP